MIYRSSLVLYNAMNPVAATNCDSLAEGITISNVLRYKYNDGVTSKPGKRSLYYVHHITYMHAHTQ